ncbi:MAG: 1-acyl-sn-glycerol-3-phosphate acyltransferase [Chloracidobacterium sp.]|nr:1-acyl-sn-glycerol-3-phosphate acyltransferase [Chloracidobacterium sp.]
MKTIRASIRIFMFAASTLGAYVIWFVGNLLIPNKVYWRQMIFNGWTWTFTKICGMKIEIIGTPPKPPYFLVCNHLSYADMAALRQAVVGVFVAKSEILTWPLAGAIIKSMGTVFIDRTNRRDIPRAGRQIIERLDAGEGVIVFPEGTTSKGEDVLPFNSSFLQFAAESDVPVSYAAVTYRTPDGAPPASTYVCWWEDISFFAHIWRMFKLSGFTTVINFGEAPIKNTDRKALAAELRQKVSDAFIPVV